MRHHNDLNSRHYIRKLLKSSSVPSGQVNLSFHLPHLNITCPKGTQCLIIFNYTALSIKKLEIITKCKRLIVLKCCARYRVTAGIDQCGDQSSEQAKEHLDFKLIDTLNLVCHLSFSFQFWNSLCLEIMYQADTFRQTHRTTEANSLAQQAIKRLFYFYLPKIQFTCFGQSNLGFSYPVNAVLISPLVQVL